MVGAKTAPISKINAPIRSSIRTITFIVVAALAGSSSRYSDTSRIEVVLRPKSVKPMIKTMMLLNTPRTPKPLGPKCRDRIKTATNDKTVLKTFPEKKINESRAVVDLAKCQKRLIKTLTVGWFFQQPFAYYRKLRKCLERLDLSRRQGVV